MPRPERSKVAGSPAGFLKRHLRTLSGLLICAVLAAMGLVGKQWFSDPWRFPLNVVEVKGECRHLDRQVLQQAVLAHSDGGFFSLDVDAVRAAVEQLPWVYRVKARRVWPDTLRLSVEEQQPVAHWGDDGLLNRYGEVFLPGNSEGLGLLPAMSGPQGLERRVFEIYQQASRMLAPLQMRVTGVLMDERRALAIEVDGGLQLALGRSDTWLRLQRFVRAWPGIAELQARPERIDLRYSNGFSVSLQAEAGTVNEKRG